MALRHLAVERTGIARPPALRVPHPSIAAILGMVRTSIATTMVSAANETGGPAVQQTVTVDRDFARFGNKSYAINKINSVEVRGRRPHGEGAVYGWGLLALIFVLTFIGSMSSDDGVSFLAFGLTMLCGWLAYRAWLKSKIMEYQLFLMTSSSEAQAFVSRDGQEVRTLRDQIESAMARSS